MLLVAQSETAKGFNKIKFALFSLPKLYALKRDDNHGKVKQPLGVLNFYISIVLS